MMLADRRPPRGPTLLGTASGFTILEMSIVLAIIGFIVGGIMLGTDLIAAATIRSQIRQIDQLNMAVHLFQIRYNNLPGDIPDPLASNVGLQARGPYTGQGDGNGIIEGNKSNSAGANLGTNECGGETPMFWVDLNTAGFLPGTFNTATTTATGCSLTTTAAISSYFPTANIGGGNYVYVWSGGPAGGNATNYFGLSVVTLIGGLTLWSVPGLTVQQAYNIDYKTDDGLPQSGRVMATYVSSKYSGYTTAYVEWAAGGTAGANSGAPTYGPTTTATAGSSTTCYDNGGVNGAAQKYSTNQNSGNGINCALSFQWQ
jgi:prepilin-type N-terminal cleavage/methylation domain-containing protein